ncbi:hypothetical protein C8R44DRAFT_853755 [Mycena epipterygia]|nr:hypothetical protein C8R44DRAFT_853755 [Mycena epipterygia]
MANVGAAFRPSHREKHKSRLFIIFLWERKKLIHDTNFLEIDPITGTLKQARIVFYAYGKSPIAPPKIMGFLIVLVKTLSSPTHFRLKANRPKLGSIQKMTELESKWMEAEKGRALGRQTAEIKYNMEGLAFSDANKFNHGRREDNGKFCFFFLSNFFFGLWFSRQRRQGRYYNENENENDNNDNENDNENEENAEAASSVAPELQTLEQDATLLWRSRPKRKVKTEHPSRFEEEEEDFNLSPRRAQ